MSLPPPRKSLHMIDLSALVVGYSLAALLIRAFWHSPETTATALTVVLALVYGWLGLAMSGPIVLLLDRRAAPRSESSKTERRMTGARAEKQLLEQDARGRGRQAGDRTPSEADSSARYTRAELAWLSIGAYWIAMTFLVVPARLHDTPLALVAVLQIVAGLALWVFSPRRRASEAKETTWTHRAAIVLLVTWPVAWVAMILLSKTVS